MTLVNEIKEKIEECLKLGYDNKIIIYPYGDMGMQVKQILNECYGLEEAFIIDNRLSNYNTRIKAGDFLRTLEKDKYIVFIATLDEAIEKTIRESLLGFWNEKNVISLITEEGKGEIYGPKYFPKVGKYTYGSLCQSFYIESIGAFCSIGPGCSVVGNHEMEAITTHPFLCIDDNILYNNRVFTEWDQLDGVGASFYFKGVQPKRILRENKKIKIGNDVWLGRNVTITNGANIGNGVVAGAGAVITKDVPDYAVVVGVPARIIRYRYTPEQIEALNRIQWWNWTDEQIRERHDDLYMPIDEFINKYDIEC